MASFAPAMERDDLVVFPLKRLFDHLAVAVELDSVDIFEIGKPAPGRKQTVGRRAAILVAEDHRITDPPSALRVFLLVPHQQRDIGEPADGVGSRVENRGQSDRSVFGMRFREEGEDNILHFGLRDVLRRRLAVEKDPQGVRPFAERSKSNRVVGERRTSDQEQMLRVAAVNLQPQDRSLSPVTTPVAAGTGRPKQPHHFGALGDFEADLLDGGESRRLGGGDGPQAHGEHGECESRHHHLKWPEV